MRLTSLRRPGLRRIFSARGWLPLALYAGMLSLSATALLGQLNTETKQEQRVEGGTEPGFAWHVINTAIFAIGIGYALVKWGPSFFNARSADIQKAIRDATGLKMEAEFRSSEIDRKMATLPQEVERMREQSRQEMEREHERTKANTVQELQHIDSTVSADIDGMRAEGAAQLRMRATRAAIGLAEKRLKERASSGEADPSLLGDFVRLVERGRE